VFRGRDTLPPIVLQVVGILAFIFFCAFWAITGRLAPELLAASGTLYGVGLASEARRSRDKESSSMPVAPARTPELREESE
jgi:hypothetical protein